MSPFEGPDQIFIGNGQGLPIHSSSSSYFTSQNNPKMSLALHNLLHVPHITKNLISVSKFAKDNFVYYEFHPTYCLVKSQVTNEVLVQGNVGSDGLYCFPNLQLQAAPSNSSAFIVSNNSNIVVSDVDVLNNVKSSSHTLWHARLGHPNFHVQKLVSQQCNIPVVNKIDGFFCNACCMGKAHRLPSNLSNSVYKNPLELVYRDLWGPAPIQSSNNYKYYLSFVDAYSRFTWIYLLQNKSDTLTVFKQFKMMVELQFNTSLKSLQTDWVGEFRPLSKYLKDLGVNHKVIFPHTHHQNGVIERKHRHIVELGLTQICCSIYCFV
uniref:Retrovirus-related Pol polyprotein from transposon TNT 1-94 n=1 Tax=Cajanus cajan TaxID=3821 RepID=A0A151R399_CAJCA|nr:Retrovirus-related Pol polyprotein from transposon TNT 1-94 [Cajanus cajan]